MDGVRRVLYRLPKVLKAQTVCVAEGEKDCGNLEKLGFVATTNPLGAAKWRDEYSETLRGKTVLIFGDVGDPDKQGERHTEQVIQSLTGKANLLTHVRLPGGFHDVSDFIKWFSSPDEAKTAIEKLIEQEREKSETKPAITSQKAALTEQPRVQFICIFCVTNRALSHSTTMSGPNSARKCPNHRFKRFKSLARDFEESARSGFFALLSRRPTDGLATARHAGRCHAR